MAEYSTSIHIEAPPEIVFAYLTRPERMVAWMGERATLEPVRGGRFEVDIRGNPFRGQYLEVEPPHRLVVSWGLAGSDDFPPGSSRVEFVLSPTSGGTNLKLVHSDLPETRATTHGLGWTHYLGRLQQAASGAELGPDAGFVNQRRSTA
jgi:uncharacterized protein YndB with AHSA1/START domain